MGNICRSPSAEGFFLHHLKDSKLQDTVGADSAGTHSYHLGYPPDSRAIAEASRFGVDIADLRARKVLADDFNRFDLILGMDEHNLQLIDQMDTGNSRAATGLMMNYAPDTGYREVPDPYYGSQSDFTLMCELLDKATRALVSHIESELG